MGANRGFELIVFLLLLLPSVVQGVLGPAPPPEEFSLRAASIILRDVSLMALIAYFLRIGDERFEELGWRRSGAWREALLGAALFIPTSSAALALGELLWKWGVPGGRVPPSFLEPSAGAEQVLALLLIVVVAVTEETVFRGYLVRRFLQVGGSRVLAVLGSSVVFGLGHGYEGPRGMITVGIVGAVAAVVFLWRGSIVAPVVMHALQDLFVTVIRR